MPNVEWFVDTRIPKRHRSCGPNQIPPSAHEIPLIALIELYANNLLSNNNRIPISTPTGTHGLLNCKLQNIHYVAI